MKTKTFLNELLLIFGTMIWGAAFVFQDMGNNYVEPLTFNVERNLIAFIFLLIIYLILKLTNRKKDLPEKNLYTKKNLFIGSLVCGLFLSLAMALQQIGISIEGAGKSGFITALYVVFVPLISLFFRKKTSILVIIGSFISLGGLFLINCPNGSFSWSNGSWMLLGCAICYSLQILSVDKYSKLCDCILLSAGQFFFACIFQIPFMFIFEHPEITNMINAWIPVLFCGIASSGIAYTIQIYTQKNIPPTIATIIMSMESVFSIIAAIIILSERYSLLELIGCILIFIAIIVSQLKVPQKSKNKFKKNKDKI